MWFVGIGMVLLLLKLADVAVMGRMPWWGVAVPFALAAVWWAIADLSGITQRRAMAEDDERARKRRERQYEAMGMRAPRPGASPPGKRRS